MGCCKSKPPLASTSPGLNGGDKRKLLDQYVVGEMLGQGSFGVVYACKDKNKQAAECAVKMVDKVETPVEKIKEEADFLLRMAHPHIIKCFDVIYDKCFVCIVMERLRGGDLIAGMQKHWKSRGKIPIASTVHITAQMSSSINYLHRQNLVHRDVKGDNYLSDRADIQDAHVRVVLTDFGTVKECRPTQRLTEKCGTKLYWSPEFYARNYSQKVDIWAMGVVCYGLLNGRFPFRDESEVKTKVVKFREDLSAEGSDFMNGLLHKKEELRFTSNVVLNHEWIRASMEGIDTTDIEFIDVPEPMHVSTNPDLLSLRKRTLDQDLFGGGVDGLIVEAEFHREMGANAGVEQRRLELLDRIQDVQERMSTGNRSSVLVGLPIEQQPYWKDVFFVKSRHMDAKVCKFEWWPLDRAAKEIDGWSDNQESAVRSSNGSNGESSDSIEVIGKMLQEHGVAVEKFGVGEAKTLDKLAAEVQSGAAVLMLDASQHKKLVRVVHVVLLRIASGAAKPRILVEIGEKFADGRTRSTERLPGTKKEPHENSRQTAERILKDSLNFQDRKVILDLAGKEVFEEEDESPSYPGVQTVYHKEILTAHVTDTVKSAFSSGTFRSSSDPSSSETPSKTMPKTMVTSETPSKTMAKETRRLSQNNWMRQMWQFEDSKNNTKFFAWYTEKECEKKKVKFRAPEEGIEVSCFVQAPLGMEEEELKKYLESYNIDVSKFGKNDAKTLKELSAQLARGECQILPDGKGTLKRIVDVVLVKLLCPSKGVVIETQQEYSNGKVTKRTRLPGAKRRPDENQFITAKRILEKQLKVDEARVVLEAKTVLEQEANQDTDKFPGLRTTYRKRIVTASLLTGSA